MDRPRRVIGWSPPFIRLEGGINILANAEHVEIGEGTMLSPGLEIGLPDKPVERFIVGDQGRIYAGQIASRNFVAGDYLTIHEGVWAYGRNDIAIGHNCWFGRRCTLDAEGGFRVGNGLGAGQDTHMWSHIRHGDTLVGNRWLKYGEFVCGDDVWLTGRCTSAPVTHGDRSMAMVESNLTRGMPPNTVWGGNPAECLNDKIGAPFVERSSIDTYHDFEGRIAEFYLRHPDIDYEKLHEIRDTFNVSTRTYEKTGHPIEVALMRFLLPEAKFTPR